MRLHRFYVDKKIDGVEIEVREERLLNQWKNVLRYQVGDRLTVFDGSGKEWVGKFKEVKKEEAKIEILEEKGGVLPDKEITLYQSVIKKDKMEWVVEKTTELGVPKIVPIISERSEKKGFNLERAKKNAIGASEQCGRADIPEISEVMDLESSIMNLTEQAIVFDKSGRSLELGAKSLEELKTSSSKLEALSLFIGPEGGWSEKEIERFTRLQSPKRSDGGQEKAGIEILNLGNLTLRAETAAIVALSRLGGV